MSAEIVHAPKGVVIGLGAAAICTAAGFDSTVALLTTPVVAFAAHLGWDKLSHSDWIHTASEPEFNAARDADPKALIKALVSQLGFCRIFGKGGRQWLAENGQERIARPPALEIPAISMKWALTDVALSGIIALILAAQRLDNPLLAMTMLAGAFGAVLPDLLLPSFIYRRLIHFDWFWRLDTFHHWIHATIRPYFLRASGFAIQIFWSSAFISLAMLLMHQV